MEKSLERYQDERESIATEEISKMWDWSENEVVHLPKEPLDSLAKEKGKLEFAKSIDTNVQAFEKAERGLDDLVSVSNQEVDSSTESEFRTVSAEQDLTVPIDASLTKEEDDVLCLTTIETDSNYFENQEKTAENSEVLDNIDDFFQAKPSLEKESQEHLSKIVETKQAVDNLTDRYHSTEELSTFYNKAHERLSPSERQSMTLYSGEAYKIINTSLREGNLSPEVQNIVTNLQSALNQMEVPQDMILYRGTGEGAFKHMLQVDPISGDYNWEALKGKVYSDKAFLSTSVEESVANSYAESSTGRYNVLWEINVPKGTSGGMLNNLSQYETEKELLLDKNQKLLITEVNKDNNVITLKMDLFAREKRK